MWDENEKHIFVPQESRGWSTERVTGMVNLGVSLLKTSQMFKQEEKGIRLLYYWEIESSCIPLSIFPAGIITTINNIIIRSSFDMEAVLDFKPQDFEIHIYTFIKTLMYNL